MSAADDYMFTTDRDFFMECGCWTGQADHTCTKPGASRCRGCGVPDDCYCHEQCDGPGSRCDTCEGEARMSRNEDHAEALDMLAAAPAFRAGEGWIPGDSRYPATVPAEPWWWGLDGTWEWEQIKRGEVAW